MFSLFINAGPSYLRAGASSSILGLDHDGMHLTDPFELLAAPIAHHFTISPPESQIGKACNGFMV